MDPNCLKDAELCYELSIRGLETTGNVDAKRKRLRGVLNQQSSNRSLVSINNPFLFNDDVKLFLDSLLDLSNVIKNYAGVRNDPAFKRIDTRLTHLSNRFNNFNIISDDDQQQADTLKLKLIDLEGEFVSKVSEFAPMTSTPTQAVSMPLPSTSHSLHSANIFKWNVHFSGSSNESLVAFLERVELLRQARGLSKSELFASALDLFKDQAWTWFVSNKSRVSDWDSLVTKLKEDFLPYHYDIDLLEEIRKRTQGSKERVTIYIAVMESLFRRLSNPPDEQTIVNQIRRNLLPHYISHLALVDTSTIASLSTSCKRIEESLSLSDRYKPPPSRTSGLLEPDLSCGSSSGNFSSKNVSTLSNNVTCWNCDRVGHAYGNCRSPRTIFCFSCGYKNKTRPNCPKCTSKNLAGTSGGPRGATTGPFQNQQSGNQTTVRSANLPSTSQQGHNTKTKDPKPKNQPQNN